MLKSLEVDSQSICTRIPFGFLSRTRWSLQTVYQDPIWNPTGTIKGFYTTTAEILNLLERAES